MSDRQFEKELGERICKTWKLKKKVVYLPLKFERASGTGTIPEYYDDRGFLHVKVVYSGRASEDCRTLVYHEGAHMYLFELRYPPAQFAIDTMDVLAEYYAQTLDLKKQFGGTPEELTREVVARIANTSGVGVWYPILTYVRNFLLGMPVNQVLLNNTFKLVSQYLEATSGRPAPPEVPPDGKEFSPDQRRTIKSLVEDSFSKLYPGRPFGWL